MENSLSSDPVFGVLPAAAGVRGSEEKPPRPDAERLRRRVRSGDSDSETAVTESVEGTVHQLDDTA